MQQAGNRSTSLLLVLILLVGAALRLYALAGPELQWDEFLALHRASMSLPHLVASLNTQAASDVALDTSPPLHHIFIHFFRLLGDNDTLVRLPGALFGILSLLMIFLVSRQFFNERAALYSTLYCALLQFHINYSRFMRWYAFFYFFSLLSLYWYRRLLDDKRARIAAIYGLATALMLYSSYIAAPFVLAQILVTAGLMTRAWHRREHRPETWRFVLLHLLGLVLAGLLYLPQVPGQLVAYRTFYVSGGNTFDFYRVAKAFREITLYFRDSDFTGTGSVILFIVLGLLAEIRAKSRANAALLLVWCVVPTLVAFTINVQTQITAKYLIGLLYFIVFFAGAGADVLAELVTERLRPTADGRRRTLSLVFGFAAVIFMIQPNFNYAAYYRGWLHTYSNWSRYLFLHKQDVDSVMFESNRAKKVLLTRSLGDTYRRFDRIDDHAYRKFYYITQKGGFTPPGPVPAVTLPQSDETVVISRGGVVSQAPIIVSPGKDGFFAYRDDFSSLKFFETVWSADNVAPDFGLRSLSLYSLDTPGSATYKLVPAPGVRCRELRLSAQAVLRAKIRDLRPDAVLRLYAGPDPGHLTRIEEITFDTFVAANPALAAATARGTFAVSIAKSIPWGAPDAPCYLRIEYVPGHYGAFLDIENLDFQVGCDPQTPASDDPALLRLQNIAANTRILPWSPDTTPVGQPALYAFRAANAGQPAAPEGIPVGSTEALVRFRAAHPGLTPVAVLHDRDGAEAFLLYDPGLADAAVKLAAGTPREISAEPSGPWPIRGLAYTGTTSRPAITLGGQSLSVPLAVPEGSLVQLNPGDKGLVSLNPLFTPAGFVMANMAERDNLNILNNALTCHDNRPCHFTYVFASELPIIGLRTMVFPALKTDKPNYARAYYAFGKASDRHYFLDFSERGPLDESSTFEGVLGRVDFTTPAHILFVGFELSGQGARIHSDDKYTMRLELLLDAAALPPLEMPEGRTTLGQRSDMGEAMSLWLSPQPLPIAAFWKSR